MELNENNMNEKDRIAGYLQLKFSNVHMNSTHFNFILANYNEKLS